MSEGHHIVPPKVYVINFCALSVLMALTVVAWKIDFGAMALPIALAIAIAKTLSIALVFMNVRGGSHLTWVFAGAGFFWFLILIGFIIVDFADFGSMYNTGLPGAQKLIGAP